MSKRSLLRASVATAFVLVASAPPARAADIVLDPTNLAQNVLQAERALQEINHQIEQIEQQAHMLARSPLQLAPELTGSIQSARSLFQQAQGISFEVHKLSDDLHALYPETWRDFNLGAVMARSDAWMQQSRESLTLAMQTEAAVSESLDQSRARLNAALTASANAEGQTSAVQAGNQLLGVNATQLAEIQTLLAAQGRALEAERMERLAREERAGEIVRRAFPDAASSTAAPARSAF